MTDEAQVRVLLVGVGRVPESLAAAAEEVLGPQPDLATLRVENPVDRGLVETRIAEAVARLDQGRGVLLLADLCGSSVANVCYALARGRPELDVLCGANLAMLTKLYAVDRAGLDTTTLAQLLADTGRRSITLASDAFAAERADEEA